MPRVKIDYVVSFSSEDSENQANNLLAWDVNKKKWLCSKGEPSCSVVLQLSKSVKISAVHIGAYHTALVEVLVGRSEKPNDNFEVLVPSSIFLSAVDSRRELNLERVRSFSDDQLSDARFQHWDRLRVVCSQPYNKHCKYGLSFIQVYEPESASATVPYVTPSPALTAIPPGVTALDTFSSDEDDFKPGELFAKHKLGVPTESSSTEAQIRQASSQALKNVSESSTKLIKTPITKTNSSRQNESQPDLNRSRKRDSLMYNDDDEGPHAKIDRVLQRHKDEKSKDEKRESSKIQEKRSQNDNNKQNTTINNGKDKGEKLEANSSQVNKRDDNSASRVEKRRKRDHDEDTDDEVGPVSSSPHRILSDVVVVLSGYENPQRAHIRQTALALGAQCRRDWGPGCTHLICAFPNTPKLRAVRAGRGGAGVPCARAEWLRACAARRRRLPWRWFATEPTQLRPPPAALSDECDTDDEIEKVLRKQKKQRTESPDRRTNVNKDQVQSTPNTSTQSNDSDVAFVRDERIQGDVTVDSDSETDTSVDNERVRAPEVIDPASCLPHMFAGQTFVIEDDVGNYCDVGLLARYVRAYGGLVLDPSEVDEDCSIDYVLSSQSCTKTNTQFRTGSNTKIVRADWVWKCHKLGSIVPT